MAHRTFRDEHGREWEVWEVVPTTVERRLARNAAIARTTALERRKVTESRVLVPEDLQKGWLAFQCVTERRRLTPIPGEWSELTNEELLELLHRAEIRSATRRLIE